MAREPAPTWWPVYEARVGKWGHCAAPHCHCPMFMVWTGSAGVSIGQQKIVLCMQHRSRHPARHPVEVWQAFERFSFRLTQEVQRVLKTVLGKVGDSSI